MKTVSVEQTIEERAMTLMVMSYGSVKGDQGR